MHSFIVVEMFKVRMQGQYGAATDKRLSVVAREMWQQWGFRKGVMRGYWVTVMREIPAYAGCVLSLFLRVLPLRASTLVPPPVSISLFNARTPLPPPLPLAVIHASCRSVLFTYFAKLYPFLLAYWFYLEANRPHSALRFYTAYEFSKRQFAQRYGKEIPVWALLASGSTGGVSYVQFFALICPHIIRPSFCLSCQTMLMHSRRLHIGYRAILSVSGPSSYTATTTPPSPWSFILLFTSILSFR
jgi:hypothetical protein